MRITVTGATGLIGAKLVAALRERGDEVTVLSRRPADARRKLGVDAVGWHPETEPAPVDALTGRDGVVHLAGEPIAQRWTQQSKERIRSSRELGTQRLIEGLQQSQPRPRVLVTASAVGYYGARGDEHLDEDAPPGTGFLASVCEAWERAAAAAVTLGLRTVMLRTGVLLDRADGALARMLPPFRLGIGGPVAGGHQYIPGDESRVRERARPRAAPARAPADPRVRAPSDLRRDGRRRHHRATCASSSRARTRLRVPAHRDRRSAASRPLLNHLSPAARGRRSSLPPRSIRTRGGRSSGRRAGCRYRGRAQDQEHRVEALGLRGRTSHRSGAGG